MSPSARMSYRYTARLADAALAAVAVLAVGALGAASSVKRHCAS
jgi:hypothetical protein